MRSGAKFLCLLCVVCLSVIVMTAGWQEKAEAEDKGLVFYLSPNQFDEFQTTASMMLRKYVEAAGYEHKELVAGNEDIALQLNHMDNALTQNPVAIIVAAVDGTAIVAGVDKAREAGIPVITFDRVVSETTIDFGSVAGCYKIGVLAAGEIARLLKAKHGEVKGTVLDIMGDPGDSYTVLIEEGFQDTIKQYPDVKIETKVANEWLASNAANIADDYLVAYPETDLIFSHAEHLAAAITAVLETKGLEKGDKLMVSTAGMPMGLDLIRDGWLQATVEQPLAAQAEGVAMFLENVIAQEEIKAGAYTVGGFESQLIEQSYGPELQIPGSVITKENVDDPKFWGNQVEK
ncbi:MAG: sugar ABC transporter substrate-binding protein [bacterium]|nr:sugar ABC transporter substrate-binding protein [bacterium]